MHTTDTEVETITTGQLLCERLRLDHLPALERLLRDPDVARTLTPDAQPPSRADVAARLEANVAHWERFGFGLWLLRDRRTGEMVGRGGLQHTFACGLPEIEAGWAILPARWGQGLASELAEAAVSVGFGSLRLRSIIALVLPDNVASRRVAEKAGFGYEREVVYVGLPHVLLRRGRC